MPYFRKWVPGAGLDAMIPKLNYQGYFKDIDIFTKFGELTPEQLLQVFKYDLVVNLTNSLINYFLL